MVARAAQNAETPDTDTVSSELVEYIPLRDIKTFEDVVALFGNDIQEATELLGDGFELLDNKDRLVDLPFVILDHKLGKSTYGVKAGEEPGSFSVVRLMTKHNEKYVIIDGGTGIHDQMMKLREEFGDDYVRRHPIICKTGLRKSTYPYTNEATGEVSEATTFYIAAG